MPVHPHTLAVNTGHGFMARKQIVPRHHCLSVRHATGVCGRHSPGCLLIMLLLYILAIVGHAFLRLFNRPAQILRPLGRLLYAVNLPEAPVKLIKHELRLVGDLPQFPQGGRHIQVQIVDVVVQLGVHCAELVELLVNIIQALEQNPQVVFRAGSVQFLKRMVHGGIE